MVTILDRKYSDAILRQAKEGGYLDDPIPEDDKEASELATFYAVEAEKSLGKPEFKKDKTVGAIVELFKDWQSKNAEEVVEEIFGPTRETHRGLPVPEETYKEPTWLPNDFTELGDKDIRKAHAQYNGYHSRAKWLYSLEVNKLADATAIRDSIYRDNYEKWNDEYEADGRKTTKDVLDTAARGDADYKEADANVRQHQRDVVSLKALMEIYGDTVDRLSREWTMRTDENKRSY
jgi:hypothetical protein